MAEYIDKQAFNDAISEAIRKYPSTFYNGLETARRIAHNLHSADVQPVRHGRWIQHYEPYDTGEEWIEAPYGFECSECGRWEAEQEPFCNCGAKMDGGET